MKSELKLEASSGRGAAKQKDPGPRRALGRGLAALIPASSAAPSAVHNGFRNLPIEKLRARADQPRKHFDAESLKELADSIRTRGILQPLLVRRDEEGFEIVAGERRWRAAQKAGLREVPVIIKELSDEHCQQVALIENIQRKDLDPIEEAQAYARLLADHELTHEALAEAVGKSRVHITHSLRILKLPAKVLELLAQGKLTPGHVKPLLSLGERSAIDKAAQDFVKRGLSVRDAESYVRQRSKSASGTSARKQASKKPRSTSAIALEERLQKSLGTRVQLKQVGRRRGWVSIYYPSLEALEGLIERLS